jgi:hypothetical protein
MEDQETEGIVTLRWVLRTGDESSISSYTALVTARNFVIRYYDRPLVYLNSVIHFLRQSQYIRFYIADSVMTVE